MRVSRLRARRERFPPPPGRRASGIAPVVRPAPLVRQGHLPPRRVPSGHTMPKSAASPACPAPREDIARWDLLLPSFALRGNSMRRAARATCLRALCVLPACSVWPIRRPAAKSAPQVLSEPRPGSVHRVVLGRVQPASIVWLGRHPPRSFRVQRVILVARLAPPSPLVRDRARWERFRPRRARQCAFPVRQARSAMSLA